MPSYPSPPSWRTPVLPQFEQIVARASHHLERRGCVDDRMEESWHEIQVEIPDRSEVPDFYTMILCRIMRSMTE